MSKANISVVINTKNAAETLAGALESVSWATEVIVADMSSQDETITIAKSYRARILRIQDYDYVEPARNEAIAAAKGEWILVLDADEEISAALSQKLTALAEGDATADAYYLPRKNIFFNDWLQHAGWWPDYQLRFFKKGSVTWPKTIHSIPMVKGTSDYIAPNEEFVIMHHAYQSIEQFLDRLNRYTTHELSSREKQAITTELLIANFSDQLLLRLFLHRGIDGGIHATVAAWLQAWYEMVVGMKQWQAQKFKEKPNQAQATIKGLRKFQSDLNYWIADWHIEHTAQLSPLHWYWRLRRLARI